MWPPRLGLSSEEILAVIGLLGIVAAVAYGAYLKHKSAIDKILEDGLSLDDLDEIKELVEDAKETMGKTSRVVQSKSGYCSVKISNMVRIIQPSSHQQMSSSRGQQPALRLHKCDH